MLNFYYVKVSTYFKGKLVAENKSDVSLLDEANAENEAINITWDNLEKVYSKYGLLVGFNYWNLSRGKKISFFHGVHFWQEPKEWKSDETYTSIKAEYRPAKVSFKTILEWDDCNKAMQYLEERYPSITMERLKRDIEVIEK